MPAFLSDDERDALEAALPEWLPRQRWFAGKGDAAPVPWAALHTVWTLSERYALGLVDAATPNAGAHRYALPLGRGPCPDDARRIAGGLYDAARDGAFWTALAGALTAARRTAGAFWITLHTDDAAAFDRLARAGGAPVRVITADHSNAAALVGDLFVRLTRRLDGTGHSPERRALTLLAGTGLAPAFVAEAALFEPARAASATLALVTDALDADASAWDVATDALRRRDAPAFAALATALGETVCRMHRALAEDRSRMPMTDEGVQALMSDVLMELQGHISEERLVKAATRMIPEGPGDALGAAFPIHGDLHLGQVLVLADGSLRVIDFEGEPARPAAERARPDSPLRDVAGMLRSFDYAVCTALPESDRAAVRTCAETAFLDAYRAAVPPDVAALWPGAEAFGPMLRGYLVQKALYEVQYERAYRPGWAWIPEAALARLLDAPGALSGP